MDTETLGADDYESVHRAGRRLAARYGPVTLNAMMEAWEASVQEVEEGLDAELLLEYPQMLRCRAWLAEAWPEFTERVRAAQQARLDALDARFAQATTPLPGHPDDARWHSRRPLRIINGLPPE
ncbi:hypothetical protein [Kitasatospora sp. NPDC002040]|uniref:hypothetical protein n=1 Tax=Kitasatospora sp. NPDC002040 TaxID=3154661 RepID=UPI00332FC705